MRILTWNVCGDSGISAANKWDELAAILDYWETQGDPVGIICLQETSGAAGLLYQYLPGKGFQVFTCYEQQNCGGRSYVIAVKDGVGLKVLEKGRIDLTGYREQETSPTRIPFSVSLKYGEQEIGIYTLHATRGGRRFEALQLFSAYLAAREGRIIVAGDLNITVETGTEDVDGYARRISELFEGFNGFDHNLDFILGRGVKLEDGINSEGSCSDHMPVSAKIQL